MHWRPTRYSLHTNMFPGWPLTGYGFTPFTSIGTRDKTGVVELYSVINSCPLNTRIDLFSSHVFSNHWSTFCCVFFRCTQKNCRRRPWLLFSLWSAACTRYNWCHSAWSILQCSVDININGYCLVLPGHQASSLWRELETTQKLPHKFCFIAVGTLQQLWPFTNTDMLYQIVI